MAMLQHIQNNILIIVEGYGLVVLEIRWGFTSSTARRIDFDKNMGSHESNEIWL
jgi:hypothetical protein